MEKELQLFDNQIIDEYRVVAEYIGGPGSHEFAKQFSERMTNWQKDPSNGGILNKEYSGWFVKLLNSHPSVTKPTLFLPKPDLVNIGLHTKLGAAVFMTDGNGKTEYIFNRNAACILTIGSLSLGCAGISLEKYITPLLFVAVGCDLVSIQIRSFLAGHIELIDPKQPRFGIELPVKYFSEMENCRLGLSHAMTTLGAAANGITGQTKMPNVYSEGIESIAPYQGNCRAPVYIAGKFPVSPPAGIQVLFPTPGGSYLPETVEDHNWSDSLITVTPSFTIGDGPVGFQEGAVQLSNDFNAVQDFRDVLGSCFGSGGKEIGLAVADNLVLRFPDYVQSSPPLLPGDANVIHGGPICTSVSPLFVNEWSIISITGKGFAPNDEIFIEETFCKTTFVTPELLTATLEGCNITGGHKHLIVRRKSCDANLLTLFVGSTLTQGQSIRCNPGDRIYISGFGFEPGMMMATINSQFVPVTCDSATSLAFNAVTPQLNSGLISADRTVDELEIKVFQGSTCINPASPIPLKYNLFRVAFFGDSVMWGQGLQENQKFSSLLGSVVRPAGDTRRILTVDRAAHSGATLLEDATDPDIFPFSVSPCVFDIDVTNPPPTAGEIPNSAISINGQINAWQSRSLNERNSIALVIMNGGINDVNFRTIINILLPDTAW